MNTHCTSIPSHTAALAPVVADDSVTLVVVVYNQWTGLLDSGRYSKK